MITTSDQGLNLWDVLIEQGQPYQLIAAGDRALENLRIESFSLKSGKTFGASIIHMKLTFMKWLI
ncbi:hypothetical protein AAAC51_40785 [Priestia megaterium]